MNQLDLFMSLISWIQIITGIILFVATADISSSEFYTILRILVFFTSLITIFQNFKKIEENGINKLIISLAILLAILFNPIIPIYIYNKGLWIFFDIVGGLFFLSLVVKNESQNFEINNTNDENNSDDLNKISNKGPIENIFIFLIIALLIITMITALLYGILELLL